jgi:FkbM family methyltransferase
VAAVIVIDVGCATHPRYPEDESTLRLLERFDPDVYIGIDPHPDVLEGVVSLGGVLCRFIRAAAWTRAGTIGYELGWNPLAAIASDRIEGPAVPCIDLADLVLKQSEPVILKLDCEGAEHDLIPHLEQTGAMDRVSLLLVEFHGDRERPAISVPWEEW